MNRKRIIIYSISALGALILLCIAVFAWVVFGSNVDTKDGKPQWFYVYTGSTYKSVYESLQKQKLLRNNSTFDFIASKKHYKNKVQPGRYMLRNGMSNNQLVNLLRSGVQEPVKVVFHNIRTKEQFAGRIASQLEADSVSILTMLNDSAFLAENGYNSNTVISLFIPNTYEFYWTTTAKKFLNRMVKESELFWNTGRMEKAGKMNLTPVEVITLASIVEEESQKNDERPTIAGVYYNRLQKGMLLQADPTVKYAVGDFTLRRILNVHTEYDSPYNTYKYKGLPPGPICIPSIPAIDAVLNYNKTNYLYFCAKEDFSGYHNFAETKEEHEANARKYWNALNARKIYR